jgi:hypothetical protein
MLDFQRSMIFVDGVCILNMPHAGPIAEASEPYRICSTTLSVILAQILHDKDSNIIVSLRATVSMMMVSGY